MRSRGGSVVERGLVFDLVVCSAAVAFDSRMVSGWVGDCKRLGYCNELWYPIALMDSVGLIIWVIGLK